MARTQGTYSENNFIGGLNTEATGLNFPDNAATDAENVIFDKKGRMKRRLGFEFETGYTENALTGARGDTSAVSSFFWQGAGGDGDSNFYVLQVGQYIYFYAAEDDMSANKHATEIDLSSHDVATSTNPYLYPCRFAAADGKLFVIGRYIEPFYVTYDPSGNTFSDTNTNYQIRVRDTGGDPGDIYGITDRPGSSAASVNESHLYNLYNQGWYYDVRGNAGALVSPVDEWDSNRTDLPANDDRWWLHLDTSEQFDATAIDKNATRGGQAPRGTFIFNAFDIDRGSVSTGASDEPANSCSSATTTSSGLERVQHVAGFANRLFYAGCNAEKYNDVIYFSQIIQDADRASNTPDYLDSTTHYISQAGNCYQDLDPTDKDLSDLLATDGGTIKIPELANVVHLEPAGNTLVVFATNGIWAIQGSEGVGFKATDFSVRKVSNQQNTANDSYVNANGTPMWVNGQGIWQLVIDQVGNPSVQSISERTIQEKFETIPASSIPYIRSTFNQREHRVYWLYRSSSSSDVSDNHEMDTCMVYDVESQAFYFWDLNTDTTVKIIDVVTIADPSLTTPNVTKFITETSSGISAAEQFDTDYKDWATKKGAGGDDYTSYAVAGYRVEGEGNKRFTCDYLDIYSEVEANSAFYIRTIWDWGGASTSSNRWSNQQEGYSHDANYEYVRKRIKPRGHGYAFQIRIDSQTGKPFNIVGWSAWLTGNQGV